MKTMWSVLTRGKGGYCYAITSFILMLCIGVAATSCKDESLIGDGSENPTIGGETLPAGTKLYTYIKLVQADGTYTRAGKGDDTYGGADNKDYDADFEAGKDDESRIDNLLFIFYDKEGNWIAQFESDSFTKKEYEDKRDPSKDDGMVLDKDDEDEKDDGVIIEKIGWETLIKVELKLYETIDKDKIGSYFVVLNYNQGLADELKEKKQSDVVTTIVNNYQLSETDEAKPKGFLMTTAGHFNKVNEGNYLWYDELPEGNEGLYESVKEAKDNPLTVYVERLASRIEFEIDTQKIEPIEVLYGETDVYKLWFKPDFWAVEAQEKNSYLNKNLENPQKEPDYRTVNVYHNDFADWIDYKQNRVFWAKSPSFILFNEQSDNTYPVEGTEVGYDDNTLLYVTFKGIEKDPVKQLTESEESSTLLQGMDYVLEHTFPHTEWGNLNDADYNTNSNAINPYAVPTSAVLRGRYSAEYVKTDERPDAYPDKGQNEEIGDKLLKGFYIRFVDLERTDNTSEGDNPGNERYQYHLYLEEDGEHDTDYELRTAMLKEQYMIWKLKDGEYTPVKEGDQEAKVFEIRNAYLRHDVYNDEDQYIKASNTYTLQIKENADLETYKIYLKTSKNEEYREITTTNDVTAANKALLKQLGYAQHYWNAYAFFYAPIPHYAGEYDPFVDKNGNSTYKGLFNYKINSDGSYVRSTTGNYVVNHFTGDFGVVRNHIYNIKITKIGSLGYGIPAEETIPLPEPRPDHKLYQFDLELKVLPWNQFRYTFDI